MFAVKKFFQYLFGQKFILVTDHKPLLAIYGNKKSSGMVANRLARWALYLNQFDFQIEYRKTADHQGGECRWCWRCLCNFNSYFSDGNIGSSGPAEGNSKRCCHSSSHAFHKRRMAAKEQQRRYWEISETCRFSEHATWLFAVWYQSCDSKHVSPSSAQTTSWRTLWYSTNETACQNRCLLAKYW